MVAEGHRINKKVEIKKFLDIIRGLTEENIYFTNHSFFRLKADDRKTF